MNCPDLGRELLRALTLQQIDRVGQELGLHPKASDDAARHILGGLYLDARAELATRSGEGVGEYLRSKMSHLRASPATAHLFAVPEMAPDKPIGSPPAHRMSARQRLDAANGIDPMAGL